MSLKIGDLKRPAKLKGRKQRVGRGIGCGKGKTSGRGHKGAKARSGGGKYNPGFEGGQMPLIRRLPKRGFTNKRRIEWQIVNLGTLQKTEGIKDGSTVDKKILLEQEILRKNGLPFKVLAKGKFAKELTVKADKFSKAAKKAIEKAGGTALEIKE
jgi:large subunit ribosomal protein L15